MSSRNGAALPAWPESPLVSTRTKVAAFFGVSDETIRQWLQRGMPKAGNGFDLREIIRWKIEQGQVRGDASKRKQAAEARKVELHVEKQELELSRARGELVSREAVRATWASMFGAIRSKVEAWPGHLAASVPSSQRADFVADLEQKTRNLLRELSQIQDGDGGTKPRTRRRK